MDADRFDALARSLSATPTRRAALRLAAGALGALTAWLHRPVAASHCPSGTYHCGGRPDAECCQIGLQCCRQTGLCCAPGETCFRLPDGDLCKPECGDNSRRCAAGAGECCPLPQQCCGAGFRICCGPNESCETSQSKCGSQPAPCCRVDCPFGQIRCAAGTGDCCTPVLQHCCGPRCCGPNQQCKLSGGVHRCEELCLPGTRRCGTNGPCCPDSQKCCKGRCCAPGQACRSRGRGGSTGRRRCR